MRKIQNTPKDRAFYNEHGGSLRAYTTLANTGQLLSGASLALAVFSILRDAIAGYGFTATSGLLVAIAALIGFFVELANRLLARPSIRPLVVKDQFADNAEKRQRHKLLTRLSRIGLFVVGSLSLFLSWRGSFDAGKLVNDDPPTFKADSLNTAADARLQAVTVSFAADTAALLAPYATRATAARQQFAAIKSERERAAQNYVNCKAASRKYCRKQRRTILGEIDEAEAVMSATLATIAAERGATLAGAIKRRDAALMDATTRNDSDLQTAQAEHDTATTDAQSKASSTGYIFAVLTLVGQLVFYLMTYLILQIKAGSEIEEELQPNEFYDQPSVLSDLRALINHRVERGARRLIRYLFGERERMTDGLPYVQIWDAPTTPTEPTEPTATAAADVQHAPGFYRAADDPHTTPTTPNARVTFNTPHTPPHTTATHTNSPEAKQAQSRLMQYRRRLGEHTQKAQAQQRKNGTVTARTAQAIENNRKWVNHYEQILKDLSNEQGQ